MFYILARLFLFIYFLLYHRVSVRGRGALIKFLGEHNGPVILAANHESYLDPPLIGMAYPGRLRFVAWDHLFDSWILGTLIRALGAVPVSQENKLSAAGLLRQVMGFVEEGSSVLIFPEGKRSEDGTLLPLEGGTALVALKTGAPIVPVWIEGTYEAYPVRNKYPRPGKVTLTFGEPIFPGDLPAEMSEKEKRASLLSSLRSALEAMRDGQAGA